MRAKNLTAGLRETAGLLCENLLSVVHLVADLETVIRLMSKRIENLNKRVAKLEGGTQ